MPFKNPADKLRWQREDKRWRYHQDPEFRSAERERNRKRYHALSGPEYNRRLLQQRRVKALHRIEERNRRGNSGSL